MIILIMIIGLKIMIIDLIIMTIGKIIMMIDMIMLILKDLDEFYQKDEGLSS